MVRRGNAHAAAAAANAAEEAEASFHRQAEAGVRLKAQRLRQGMPRFSQTLPNTNAFRSGFGLDAAIKGLLNAFRSWVCQGTFLILLLLTIFSLLDMPSFSHRRSILLGSA